MYSLQYKVVIGTSEWSALSTWHLFTAFDHSIYQQLIARHISDVLSMPQPLLTMLQQGGFVVSISGQPWHSVGIDEAHEMLINRSCKTSIVKPSPDRVACYLPHRSRTLENLQQQLFPEDVHHKPRLILSPMSRDPSTNRTYLPRWNSQMQSHYFQ